MNAALGQLRCRAGLRVVGLFSGGLDSGASRPAAGLARGTSVPPAPQLAWRLGAVKRLDHVTVVGPAPAPLSSGGGSGREASRGGSRPPETKPTTAPSLVTNSLAAAAPDDVVA